MLSVNLYLIINTVPQTNGNIYGVDCPSQVHKQCVTIKSKIVNFSYFSETIRYETIDLYSIFLIR